MKKRTALSLALVAFLIAGLGIWHRHTRTTLEVEQVGRLLDVRNELCNGISQLYPPTLSDRFPVYSPDGRYYVEVRKLWPWEPRKRIIEMYEADSGNKVGRYVSSERWLFVFCWAEDSTGIFVNDHSPGSGSLFIILQRPPTDHPVVKLQVPE